MPIDDGVQYLDGSFGFAETSPSPRPGQQVYDYEELRRTQAEQSHANYKRANPVQDPQLFPDQGVEETQNSPKNYWVQPETPQPIQYFDAPYAEKYGMDAATAYSEALANTAYQRKVADLQKAGLNPVLGIQGSGASVVSGSQINSGSSGYRASGSGTEDAEKGSIVGQLVEAVVPYAVGGIVGARFGSYAGSAAKEASKALINVLSTAEKK